MAWTKKPNMENMNSSSLLLLLFASSSAFIAHSWARRSHPLACHDPNRVCSAYLYYLLASNESKADVASLFNVGPQDLITDPFNRGPNGQGLYIRVNCSCLASSYQANASYNATTGTTVASIIRDEYARLAWARNFSATVPAGTSVPISLLCGCLDNTREYGSLLNYVAQPQDKLSKLSAHFNSSIESIVPGEPAGAAEASGAADRGKPTATRMSTVSPDLLWQLVKKNNKFLVKRNGNSNASVQFTSKPNNLYNLNSFKYSGLANKKTVSIRGAGDLSVELATTKTRRTNKPKDSVNRSLLKRDFRRMATVVVNQVSENGYRPDLKNAALARLSSDTILKFREKEKETKA